MVNLKISDSGLVNASPTPIVDSPIRVKPSACDQIFHLHTLPRANLTRLDSPHFDAASVFLHRLHLKRHSDFSSSTRYNLLCQHTTHLTEICDTCVRAPQGRVGVFDSRFPSPHFIASQHLQAFHPVFHAILVQPKYLRLVLSFVACNNQLANTLVTCAILCCAQNSYILRAPSTQVRAMTEPGT